MTAVEKVRATDVAPGDVLLISEVDGTHERTVVAVSPGVSGGPIARDVVHLDFDAGRPLATLPTYWHRRVRP